MGWKVKDLDHAAEEYCSRPKTMADRFNAVPTVFLKEIDTSFAVGFLFERIRDLELQVDTLQSALNYHLQNNRS